VRPDGGRSLRRPGITVYAQALAKDPAAPRNVALTAGLEVHVE
jgi:hypothetical protein